MSLRHDYHDSGAAPTALLPTYRDQAQKQDAAILDLFDYAHPDFTASPSQVHALFPHWPLTSIRRALSNLTARGELEKLPETVMGNWGRPEHVWRRVRGQGRLL